MVALEIHLGPFPRQSVLESSPMLSLLQEDRALGLQSELQKQGQILNPQGIEILNLSSYGYDLAFRDEKSSPKLRR